MGLVCFRLKVTASNIPELQYIHKSCVVLHEFPLLWSSVSDVGLNILHFISCSPSHQGSNELNQKLLKRINKCREIYLVPCHLDDRFVLRFAICARTTESHHIQEAWRHITKLSFELLQEHSHWLKGVGGHAVMSRWGLKDVACHNAYFVITCLSAASCVKITFDTIQNPKSISSIESFSPLS